MTWEKSTTTKHTCGGPVFGRKTPGCPRCDELLKGAAPVVWNIKKPIPYVPCRCDKCTGKAPAYPPCTANQW